MAAPAQAILSSQAPTTQTQLLTMDSVKDTLANVSLYDVKAYVRKAQNAVLNFSDIEAKVREATNNEPWGASTSLMQEIADATNHYQQFHEIMPFIYRRFTEKSANEWRQIYKALQLLEYLIKNGSERVVDYARSHQAVIDMLGHFHYIDHNGKDQGINIRNRSEELVALLSDVEKIRSERKRAKVLNQKTGGGSVSSSDRSGGFGGTGRKYGGFGSSSASQFGSGGDYRKKVYGDGGGFDGSNYSGPSSANNDDGDFDEYDAGPSSTYAAAARRTKASETTSASSKATAGFSDMLSFDEKPAVPSKEAAADDDDDFADFQSAPASAAPSVTASSNILDLFSSSAPQTGSSTPIPQTTASFASPNVFAPAPGSMAAVSAGYSAPAPKKDDAFGSLWQTSKAQTTPKPTPAKAFSTPPSSSAQPSQSKPLSQDDDLLSF